MDELENAKREAKKAKAKDKSKACKVRLLHFLLLLFSLKAAPLTRAPPNSPPRLLIPPPPPNSPPAS